MPTRKLTVTDSIVYGDGVTVKDGVSGDRKISVGDNLGGFILLESGDRILLEDGSSAMILDVILEDD